MGMGHRFYTRGSTYEDVMQLSVDEVELRLRDEKGEQRIVLRVRDGEIQLLAKNGRLVVVPMAGNLCQIYDSPRGP